MPVIKRPNRILHPKHTDLVAEMVRHLTSPPNVALPPMPKIIEEEDRLSKILNVYVVWQEWDSVTQQDRAEMILEAYEQAQPGAARKISIAMGVTPLEAQTLGLNI
jgi:hypothetical protein